MTLLVKRKVIKSNPITVEYSLTQFGNSSLPIIRSLIKWGSINKRKMSRVIEKDQERAIDLLHDEIRFKNLQRKNFMDKMILLMRAKFFIFTLPSFNSTF